MVRRILLGLTKALILGSALVWGCSPVGVEVVQILPEPPVDSLPARPKLAERGGPWMLYCADLLQMHPDVHYAFLSDPLYRRWVFYTWLSGCNLKSQNCWRR